SRGGGRVIRAIEARDHDAWAELFVAYGVFYETQFSDEVVESTWSRIIAGDGVNALVAEVDGVVVGFAHYRSHPDTFSTGRDWYLAALFVSEAARGRGAATALIEHRTALAAGTLRWITAVSNTTAQRVYDKLATRTTWVTYEVRS